MSTSRDEKQLECVKAWVKAKGRGSVIAATGFGKSRVGLNIIKLLLDKKKDLKVIVVVPTEQLQTQWFAHLNKFSGLNFRIFIINTAIKTIKDCDLLIVDEIHGAAADKWIEVFEKVTYKYVLGLTGTINRLDGKEASLFKYAPICIEVPLAECLANKWVSDYIEYKVMINVDLTQYRAYTEKFMHYFSQFNFDFKLAQSCLKKGRIAKAYAVKLGISESEVIGKAVQFQRYMALRTSFITEHPKKVEIANRIIEARPESKGISFSAKKSVVESLVNGTPYHSGISKKKREAIVQWFCDLKKGFLHTAKAVDVGADFPGVNLGIIVCNFSSEIQKKQRLGRAIRLEEGKSVEIFTLVLRGTTEETWFKKSSVNTTYVQIEESDLDMVLDGKPIPEKQESSDDNPILFVL